jgi:G:T-mismatch repair DNA endonuclease (very short patch repair protein)
MNRAYWRQKILKNIARDRRVARLLRRSGYSVFTVWECQLVPSRAASVAARILAALAGRKSGLRKNSHRPA